MDQIFDTKIRDLWRKHSSSPEIQNRIANIFPESGDAFGAAKHAAFQQYISACRTIGYFDGTEGADRIARLQSADFDTHRGAMAECIAAAFFLSLPDTQVSPSPPGRGDRKLDLQIVTHGQHVQTEVKAPFDEPPGGIWFGGESPRLVEAIKNSARQFDDGQVNLLAIVPDLRRPVIKRDMVAATVGSEGISFDLNRATGELVNVGPGFRFDGRLVRKGKPDGTPAHTRVSAVVCIQEFFQMETKPVVKLHGMVVHNPNAAIKMAEGIFKGYPQYVLRGEFLLWIDPGLGD